MIRYKMIRGFMTTVVALFCLSATAGKVEVIGDGSQGTVDWKAEGAVITLTVTPTEGNFIRKSDITITKTFMPTAAQRRAEVPIGDGLTLVGADPDDLSLPRTYTVTMPGEEYDLLVRLQFSNCQTITESMVRLSETVFVYNENAQRPKVFVSGLTEGTDFTVTYDNPASASAGEYGITIKGRSTWTGTVRRTYKIFTGGKAEVNKSIEGGTIATAVDGLTVMLTVTPTDGYYIRKQDIAVAKTYMPVAAPRRSIPVADRLELTGDDPDDLSLPRTYTAQLPGWEYSAYVDAMFTERQTLTESMVTLSATSFVYNTSDQKPTISVTGLTEGKDFLVAYNGTSWADVDTYMVTITGRSTWKGTISRTWQITKAPSEVTTVPMAQSLIYSKTAQQLVNTGDAIGGTLVYGLDNTALQPVIPTGVDAGNYTVYYRVLGDANHFDSEIESVLVTIAKKAINISGITAQDKVYDGTTAATLGFDQVVYGGIVSGDNLTITAKGAFADANAGTDKNVIITELTLGGTSIANYQLAESGQQTTATATITSRSIEGAVLSDIVAQTFTGEPLTPAVSVTLDGNPLTAGTDYRVTYANNVAVGEATLTVTGIGNYQGSLQTTFAIVPTMAQVITAPAGRILTYDGTEQELVIAGEADGGTLVYSLDGTTYAAELPLGKMVNSYTISYKVQGDANHNDTEPVTIESTINKAAITISGITAQDKEYDGTTAATLGYDQVVYGGIVSGDNLTITAVGEFADADTGTEKTVNISQLTLGGTSIANYQLAESGQQTTATATITPRSIEGAILSDIAAQPYTGEPLTPAVSVTLDGTTLTAGTDYRVTYANNVNAGEATLTVTGIGNYQGSVQKTFTITALVAVVITDPQPQTLVYSGEAQQLVTAGEAEGGTMVYSLDGTDYQVAIPTGVDAKTYTVYYKVQGDSNHNDTEAETVTATITPRSIEGAVLIVSAQSYTGEPLTPVVRVTLDGTTLTAGTDYRVTYANNVNVGEATLTVTGIGNYQGSVQTTFAITSAVAVVITAPQPQTLDYSGEAQQLVTAGEAEGGTMVYSLDGTDYQEAIPTGVDAKTYTVYYKVQGDSNHSDTEAKTVTATITPRSIEGAVLIVSAQLYTGEPLTPVVRVTLDGNPLTAGTDYRVTYANNVNVGEATVIVTGIGNYQGSVQTSFAITITSVVAVVITDPQPQTLVYSGEAQQLVTAGEADGGTMLYSLDGTDYQEAIPTGVDAKTYTVYYMVQGDSNHTDTEAKTVTATITPRSIEGAVLSVSTQPYTGEPLTPAVSVTLDGTMLTAGTDYRVTYANNVNVGEATVTVMGIGNYQGSVQTTFAITTLVAVVITDPQPQTLVYSGKAQQLVTAGEAEGGTMVYSLDGTDYQTAIPTGVDAKTYTVYYKVQGDSNHSDTEAKSVTATITPRSIEGAVLSVSAQPYTGEPLTPAVSVTLDGTLLTAGTDYRVTYANNVNVGEAIVTVTGIGNYQGSVQKTFTITALVAVVITDPQPQTLVYSGEAQQLVTAGEAEGGTMVYSLDGTDYQAAIPTGVDAKTYTVYYKVLGDSNHTDTEPKTVTATITPRSIEGAVLIVSAQLYTGEPLTPVVRVTLDGNPLTAGTDYRVAYANNVNVGEATVIVTGIGNYQGSVQTSFAITSTSVVAVVITDPQPQTLVYSGEAQQLVTAGEAEGGTMLYSLDGIDYQTAIPTGVDAKTYTVYYMVQGDSNHTDSESASVNVTIAPKEVLQPTILLSTTDYTYDGTAKEPDVTVMDGEAVIAASEYTVGYANNINAGKATVTITDKEGGNYVVNGSTSFTISKVPSVITQEPQPLALDHTGEAQTLVVAGEAEGGTMVYSLDGETFTAELPSGTDAGIYTVSYKVQGDNNHSDTEVFTLKSSITPALADESGKEVDADFIEGEDGGIEVIINTLPDNFWENTDAIPSTVSDENGNKYEVTLVSAEAFDNMPSDIIVVLPEGMSTTDPVPNVINGDGTCETLDLTNVSGLSLPIDVEAEKVVYDREVTGESTTICLPYDLPVPENTTAYVLDNTDSYGITLEKYEGVLEANQPYVLMMKETASARRRGGDDTSSVINLGTSNVTISHSAEEGSVLKNNFTLCGTLHSMTHEEGLEKKAYIMLPDNSWRMTASSDPAMAKEQYLAPFQAYLLYTGVGELEEISTSFDSSTTGVQTARPNITQSPRDGWYDMNGRKLNGKPTRKGAYLHQGKVIIL